MWLVDSNIMPLLCKTDIRPACIKYTDHQAISLKINKPIKRGPGFWKFNNMYLQDNVFTNIISNFIPSKANFSYFQ